MIYWSTKTSFDFMTLFLSAVLASSVNWEPLYGCQFNLGELQQTKTRPQSEFN